MSIELKPNVWGHKIETFVCWDENGAPLVESLAFVGHLGLLSSDLRKYTEERGQTVPVAQFYGLLEKGMESSHHIFRGLERPLRTDGNSNGDAYKYIYSRKPSFDYIWEGTKQNGSLRALKAPTAAVFVVHVSANVKHLADFPDINGWINYWTWVQEDSVLPQAPIDWVERYTERVWTRKVT